MQLSITLWFRNGISSKNGTEIHLIYFVEFIIYIHHIDYQYKSIQNLLLFLVVAL